MYKKSYQGARLLTNLASQRQQISTTGPVYQNSTMEKVSQHHRAGLSKKHPGANKSAPQDWSTKNISMSKIVSQNNIPKPGNQHLMAGVLK